jgi:uncharacterized protein YtpQ (UPF0354 family)
VVIAYALDSDASYKLVIQDDLVKWSVDADAVHAAAIDGLEDLSAGIEIRARPSKKGPGVFATILTRDGYDAARLLLPGFMKRMRGVLSDTVVVGIPNRDFLIAWTPDFAAHAGFVAQIGEDVQSQPHPLTDELFIAGPDGVRLATAAEMAAQHG